MERIEADGPTHQWDIGSMQSFATAGKQRFDICAVQRAHNEPFGNLVDKRVVCRRRRLVELGHTVLTAVERFQVFAIAPLNDVAADFHAGCQHLVVDAERLRGQFEAPDPLDCAQARVYTV